MKKKILMLGGSFFQIPAIKYAKNAGYYIITVDYLPNNPGHKYSDEYFNISTTDKDAVLQLAKELDIDGIVAYASDPAALTAAYVSGKLGIPGNPFESVKILTNKDLYRNFLKDNEFNTPYSESYHSCDNAKHNLDRFNFPLMIKPVDSSGSKGVTKIYCIDELEESFNLALSFSRAKRVIIEEFINKKGAQIGGEGFVLNGQLDFVLLGDQVYNNEGDSFVPCGMTFPTILYAELKNKIHKEIQRLITLLGINNCGINIEIMLDEEDHIYLMEIGARSGGNYLPELSHYSNGFDIGQATIESSLGHDISTRKNSSEKLCSYYALHSKRRGIIDEVNLCSTIKNNVFYDKRILEDGMYVDVFNNSNNTIGILFLKFQSRNEMIKIMSNINDYVKVIVK